MSENTGKLAGRRKDGGQQWPKAITIIITTYSHADSMNKKLNKKMKEREIMIDLYRGKKEPREITSQTYQSNQKRLTKEVQDFLWGRKANNG